MAKEKPLNLNVFAKTEQPEQTQPAAGAELVDLSTVPAGGLTRSTGVGLKTDEITLIDKIAEEFDLARNAILRMAIRYFLADYLSGRLAGRLDLADRVEEPTRKPRKRVKYD